jgi:hypothetical protein
MKRRVLPSDEKRLRRTYPIDDRVAGWFFRVDEVSAGVYVAEGVDLYGRTVSRTGYDPDRLLDECVADASSFLAQ